jgi:hypothetical protein
MKTLDELVEKYREIRLTKRFHITEVNQKIHPTEPKTRDGRPNLIDDPVSEAVYLVRTLDPEFIWTGKTLAEALAQAE